MFICAIFTLMRQARIKGKGLSYYHCVSRIVDRRFIFGKRGQKTGSGSKIRI